MHRTGTGNLFKSGAGVFTSTMLGTLETEYSVTLTDELSTDHDSAEPEPEPAKRKRPSDRYTTLGSPDPEAPGVVVSIESNTQPKSAPTGSKPRHGSGSRLPSTPQPELGISDGDTDADEAAANQDNGSERKEEESPGADEPAIALNETDAGAPESSKQKPAPKPSRASGRAIKPRSRKQD